MRVQQSAAAADLGPDLAAASRHPPDGAGVVATVQGVAEILTLCNFLLLFLYKLIVLNGLNHQRQPHLSLTHFKSDQVCEYGAHEAGTEQCTARQQCTDCTGCTVQCSSRVAGADQRQTQQHNFCFPCGGGSKQRASHCIVLVTGAKTD